MPATLDVWITRTGEACAVASDDWKVSICDAHDEPFVWGVNSYSDLDAPHAHWWGQLPPGIYIVRAQRSEPPATTNAAVADVGHDGVVGVRLLPREPDQPEPEPTPTPCAITIDSVTGFGTETVAVVQVRGTASACSNVEVQAACGMRSVARATGEVAVDSDGTWEVELDTRELGCACGGHMRVMASCSTDPQCQAFFETDELRCELRPDRPR